MKLNSCECGPEPTPYLIFSTNYKENVLVKDRIKAKWKTLNEVKDAILQPFPPPEDEKSKSEIESEIGEKPKEREEDSSIRLLFEKMLALRMDKHALAIADGYRTRPQVCVCDDVCCSCFDYSNFLHNLKLHVHKKLLAREYRKIEKPSEITPRPSPKSEKILIEESEENTASEEMESRVYDEFTMKTDEDFEEEKEDSKLALMIIDRIKKMVCFEETDRSGRKCSKSEKPRKKSKKRSVTTALMKRTDGEPPYETVLNTVHRRVREFNPDTYKSLVREEARNLADLPASEWKRRAENRIKLLCQRPPWRI